MKPHWAQARIARWAFTLGAASVILPLVGVITLLTADFGRAGFHNPWWLAGAGLLLFAIVAGWFLHRIENSRLRRPALGWTVSTAYFLVFLSVLWKLFDGPSGLFFMFGFPELAGLAASLTGLVGSLTHPGTAPVDPPG